MAKQSIVSIAATIQDDLCNWEFVNFGDESDDCGSSYEVESIDLVESIDSHSSSSDAEEEEDDDHDEKEVPRNDVNVFDHHHDDAFVVCSWVSDLGQNHVIDNELSNLVDNRDNLDGVFEYNNGSISHSSGHHDDHHGEANHDDEDDGDDDDDDDDDRYDMDDDLVPWEVKDKFVRQRIRKTGKISVGRNARSKKSALVFTRPGCVRGKHGLGLKVY